MSNDFVVVLRPDGQRLFLNKAQIVYVLRDPIDESGSKTEIVTTQGAFQVRKPVEEVMSILSGKKQGEL
jgi:hypothetical protein